MAIIEGIRIRNYRVLRDVTFGRVSADAERPLTPLTAVIGKNGVGKSTLFDTFGFLSDCLEIGVEDACHARGRGGFGRLVSQGQDGPMVFEIRYRESPRTRPVTYELAIEPDSTGRPHVLRERMRQRRRGQTRGQPFTFLIMSYGLGIAWRGEHEGVSEDAADLDMHEFPAAKDESTEKEYVVLDDSRRLGIATYGSLKNHPRIASFVRFIRGWHLSYFTPDAARSLPITGPQKHLNRHGDNLSNVVQFMEREHPARWQTILKDIAGKIPGIHHIETKQSDDGRLLLRFNDHGFRDPFYVQQVSDGTLKLFAYLLLLADPSPAPFLCIEEPENGLYHKLLEILGKELREHTNSRKGSSQVFVTTHHPHFVDALEPEEVWVMKKGDDGFAVAQRASDLDLVRNLVAEGLPLGGLWYSDYLDAR